MRAALTALAAAVLIAGIWFAVVKPRQELAAVQLEQSQRELAQLEHVIEAQARHIEDALSIRAKHDELLALIKAQGRASNQKLEELKRSDQSIKEYFSQLVPGDVGRLYHRTETTDPAGYRNQGLQLDALPVASPGGGEQ